MEKMTNNTDKKMSVDIDFSNKTIKGFIIFLTLVMGAFYYMQFSGIKLFTDTEAEHEGQNYSHGGHHK
jgi:hypothetical protein